MKKYILFQYYQYYPLGGLCDITDSYDDLELIKEMVQEDPADYNEVVDRDTWDVVWSHERWP